MKKSGVRGPKSKGGRKAELRKSKPSSGRLSGLRSASDSNEFSGRTRTPDVGLRTLIVGYGNPLRSDDAFGWYASRLIAEQLAGHDIEVLTCHQLTPELAERLSRCRSALFLDADAADGKPGDIHRRVLRPEAATSAAFTHTCTPAGLLANSQQLYGHSPKAIAITVTAQSFEFGEVLTPVVAASLPKVLKQVQEWLGTTAAGSKTQPYHRKR